MKDVLNSQSVQVAVLDLEASGFGHGSYPIEVGLALSTGTPRRIVSWSSLITPTPEWADHGFWSERSAAVHGISLSTLRKNGQSPSLICDWLNAVLGPKALVISDAPIHDQSWLETLFRAGDREQIFTLYNIEVATADFNADQHRHFRYLLRRSVPPHRAGPDALRLAVALWETHLGGPVVVESRGDPFASVNRLGEQFDQGRRGPHDE